MEKGRVTSKGQIVIPSKIRRRHNIKRGTFVSFQDAGKKIILTPCTDDYIDSLKGAIGLKGKALKALLEEKKREREL